jgi:hypothetical protein
LVSASSRENLNRPSAAAPAAVIDLLARNSAAISISERVAHAAPLVHVKSEESNPPREKPETE